MVPSLSVVGEFTAEFAEVFLKFSAGSAVHICSDLFDNI